MTVGRQHTHLAVSVHVQPCSCSGRSTNRDTSYTTLYRNMCTDTAGQTTPNSRTVRFPTPRRNLRLPPHGGGCKSLPPRPHSRPLCKVPIPGASIPPPCGGSFFPDRRLEPRPVGRPAATGVSSPCMRMRPVFETEHRDRFGSSVQDTSQHRAPLRASFTVSDATAHRPMLSNVCPCDFRSCVGKQAALRVLSAAGLCGFWCTVQPEETSACLSF